jgi:outer membrane protein OmpA-like peptidoglycan-associated protein
MLKLLIAITMVGIASIALAADVVLPAADLKGSKDNPLLRRYEGSVIVVYEHAAFGDFTVPLSKLVRVQGEKYQHEPAQKNKLEGEYTKLVYLIPANRSPLEVLRNYQDEIKKNGGKVLFECAGEQCGGNSGEASCPTSASGRRHSDTSLANYLYPCERITAARDSASRCAVAQSITDQRYMVAELPGVAELRDRGTHVSVLTYTMKTPSGRCGAFNGRTIAVVDVVRGTPREEKMVLMQAGEMASAISRAGAVALYGIYFDFDKADVKAESEPTLDQIARLLKDNTALKLLVVGHTDSVGGFASNMELSQRRAAAVVSALVTRYSISPDRLTPVGVSSASPVASNKFDEGRAKNRRVELVEN